MKKIAKHVYRSTVNSPCSTRIYFFKRKFSDTSSSCDPNSPNVSFKLMTIFHFNRLIIFPTTKQQKKIHFAYYNAFETTVAWNLDARLICFITLSHREEFSNHADGKFNMIDITLTYHINRTPLCSKHSADCSCKRSVVLLHLRAFIHKKWAFRKKSENNFTNWPEKQQRKQAWMGRRRDSLSCVIAPIAKFGF